MNFPGPSKSFLVALLFAAGLSAADAQQPATPAAPSGAAQQQQQQAQPQPETAASQTAQPAATPQSNTEVDVTAGGTIRGTVKSGTEKNAVPLPGVNVTATNALTGEKYATVTDANGAFAMHIPKDGRYVLRAELSAFAPATKSVLLNAASRSAQVALTMELASRVQEQGTEAIAGAGALGMTGRGTQSLNLQGTQGGAAAAGIGGLQAALPAASQSDTGADALSVTGAEGSTSAAFNFEAARQSAEDQRALQGSTEARGTGASGGGAGNFGFLIGNRGFGGGGGSFRRFNPNAIHGSVVYQLTNSTLNARNFSVTGQPTPQPSYGTNRYGLIYSGPLIPKLLETKTDFLFLAVVGNHGSTLFDQTTNVPTLDERAGFFPTSNPLYNPYTGAPYPTATAPSGAPGIQIPGCGGAVSAGCLSPISLALLPYIPLPNQVGTLSEFNYRNLEAQHTNTDQINARYIHNFGSGAGGATPLPPWMRTGGTKKLTQNLNANFNFQHTSEDQVQLFPDFGGKSQLYQFVLTGNYSVSKNSWTNQFTVGWNHTDSESRNFFTGVNNVAGNAGILGVGVTPFFYGLPTVQFSGYGGGTETQPSSRIQQVLQLSEGFIYIHKNHNMRFGGDVRRIFLDVIGGVQGTGALTFSGFATENPATESGNFQNGGDGFADFLVGLPQKGTLQEPCSGAAATAATCMVGPEQYTFRGNEFSLYAQDTWHARANLSILYGLRYEYFSPYSEVNDRIANLDPNASFTDVAIVTPNQVGPFNGKYPRSLVQPFRDGFSPRMGVAWKALKNTVVRAGYGINYNTSVYGNFVQDLGYQRPFAIANNNTQQKVGATAPPTAYFTLANGLTDLGNSDCAAPPCITNNYSVDKNYRMGYVQGWNIDVQQTLGRGYLLNVGYNGSKGTHLDGLLAPNRILNVGPSTPSAEVFDREVSQAQSSFNALAIRLRKRLQNGIAIGATYTYSHSIDDASTIGGTSAVVAQQPLFLKGDLGNSSFDQRHIVKGDFTYELPFGPQSKYLNNSNWISHAFAGLQLYGDYTFATGTPLNPFYQANAAEVSSGVTNSLRPDRIPGSSLEGGPSQLLEWFNRDAFLPPCTLVTPGDPASPCMVTANNATTYHYGSAGRNSIPGPGVREFDMAFSKYVSFGGAKSVEFRATANNIFNLVQYNSVNTALDSPTAGRVSSAAAMRNIVIIARYRF